MQQLMDLIASLNAAVHQFVWGPVMIALLMLTGVYFTVGTGFFQFRRVRVWLGGTLFAIFSAKEVHDRSDPHAISQFQAVSTALAGTIGTGNIVGVATALLAGGSGAVFWMWISALLGMMTKYAENVLGNLYRYRDAEGSWKGGPMVYIERGLGCRWLARLFAIFCVFASFGIGNMTQANSIAGALFSSLRLPPLVTGLLLTLLAGTVILGGIKRIGAVAEKFVPFMALGYIAGGVLIILLNRAAIPQAFADIFANAFSLRAAAGGAGGCIMAQALRYGVARGVASNEAGLGSSVIVNCASNVKNPVRQGMWGVFEVFISTIVICTVTALCILTTGVLDPTAPSSSGAALSLAAFTRDLGPAGGLFLSLALVLFAFSTLIGWSYYGERAIEYLFGPRPVLLYKFFFVLMICVGCVSQFELVWSVSDSFNGLMSIPNLLAVLVLSPEVFTHTRAYFQRPFATTSALEE